jgi:serine/threonine-protein kinase
MPRDTMPARRAELAPGALVGAWTIEAVAGRGATGIVYRVARADGRRGALKLLHARAASDETSRARFAREIDLAARVEHPNLARRLDAGTQPDGRPYLVSEWIDGESLDQRLARGRLAAGEALDVLRGVAAALDAAHAAGVIHRDVKPANVLLGPGVPPANVRLVDLGAARAVDDAARLTATGALVGTPAYMAPEQLAGGTVGVAADVYALAALAFHALTGEPPFADDDSMGALDRRAAPPRASALAELPRSVDEVLQRGLAVAAEDRPAGAGALVVALAAALEGARGERLSSRDALAVGVIARGGNEAARAAFEHDALAAGFRVVRRFTDAVFCARLLPDGAAAPPPDELARLASALVREPGLVLRSHAAHVRVLVVRGSAQIVGGPLLDLSQWSDH